MTAQLIGLPESTLQDVPATLRRLADGIEAGDYGPARGCVVVIDATRIEVAYAGIGEPGPRTVLLLQAGAAKMVQRFLDSRAAP